MLRQTPSGIHFFDNEVTESSALVLPSFEGSTQLRNLVVGQLENAHVQQDAEREGIINRPAIRPFTCHQVKSSSGVQFCLLISTLSRRSLATFKRRCSCNFVKACHDLPRHLSLHQLHAVS